MTIHFFLITKQGSMALSKHSIILKIIFCSGITSFSRIFRLLCGNLKKEGLGLAWLIYLVSKSWGDYLDFLTVSKMFSQFIFFLLYFGCKAFIFIRSQWLFCFVFWVHRTVLIDTQDLKELTKVSLWIFQVQSNGEPVVKGYS